MHDCVSMSSQAHEIGCLRRRKAKKGNVGIHYERKPSHGKNEHLSPMAEYHVMVKRVL